jgi:hypothetical protein
MTLTSKELTNLVVERLRANPLAVSYEVIADFCDVKRPTVAGWFAGAKPLGGLYTIKLWHLLAVTGIPSPELEVARSKYPLGEYIGRLLAFDVITMERALKICKVKENAIFLAARTEGTLSRCTKTFQQLVDEYDETLKMFEEDLRSKIGSPSTASQVARVEESLRGDSVVSERGDLVSRVEALLGAHGAHSRQELVFQVAKELLAALVAANMAVTDFTPEERTKLRSLMGQQGMFELSNTIERLCGERAFNRGGN